jgi:hypothetical protein
MPRLCIVLNAETRMQLGQIQADKLNELQNQQLPPKHLGDALCWQMRGGLSKPYRDSQMP